MAWICSLYVYDDNITQEMKDKLAAQMVVLLESEGADMVTGAYLTFLYYKCMKECRCGEK